MRSLRGRPLAVHYCSDVVDALMLSSSSYFHYLRSIPDLSQTLRSLPLCRQRYTLEEQEWHCVS